MTLLPRLAVQGGVLAGASLALRPLEEGASRTLGLAWRARSPRAAEFRGLVEAVRQAVETGG